MLKFGTMKSAPSDCENDHPLQILISTFLQPTTTRFDTFFESFYTSILKEIIPYINIIYNTMNIY